MVSSFNQKHNKYTSTPDWFKDSKSIGDSVAGSGTNYGGAVIGSTYNTVDYNEIPIDNSTIIWQDEKLAVPIDNSTIIINDEKLSVPIDNDTIIIKDGKLVVSFDDDDLQGDYVTIKEDQDIEGVKNFKPGILIDGVEVIKPQDNVIYIGSNLVVKGGITMYSEAGDADISGIYEGLPIDMETLVRDENGVLMVNPNIDLGGASTWDELTGKPTWITVTKPRWDYETDVYNKPNLSVYATLDYVNNEFEKYVTLDTAQTIIGEKNFTGGLKVNGGPIVYNATSKYWKLEGDLLITGGVTMYGNDSEFVPSTIMDAIETDEVTITKKNGVLQAIGNTGGGSINEDEIKQIIESYDYLTSSELPIASTSTKGIASFDSSSFNVSNGHVSFSGAKVKVVTSAPTTYESDTLYVITG